VDDQSAVQAQCTLRGEIGGSTPDRRRAPRFLPAVDAAASKSAEGRLQEIARQRAETRTLHVTEAVRLARPKRGRGSFLVSSMAEPMEVTRTEFPKDRGGGSKRGSGPLINRHPASSHIRNAPGDRALQRSGSPSRGVSLVMVTLLGSATTLDRSAGWRCYGERSKTPSDYLAQPESEAGQNPVLQHPYQCLA